MGSWEDEQEGLKNREEKEGKTNKHQRKCVYLDVTPGKGREDVIGKTNHFIHKT